MLKFQTHSISPRCGRIDFCFDVLQSVVMVTLLLCVPCEVVVAQPHPPSGLVFGPPERISLTATGEEPDAPSFGPTVSADGRFVMFTSRAGNLLPGMPPASEPSSCERPILPQWYVLDRPTRRLERVSRSMQGLPAEMAPGITNCSQSTNPPYVFRGQVSADGRFASFMTQATNLRTGDVTVRIRLYRVDRSNGDIRSVAVNSNGDEVGSIREQAQVLIVDDSANRYVIECREMLGLPTSVTRLWCLKDLDSGQLRPAILGNAGEAADANKVIGPAISGDGRVLVYLTSDQAFLPEQGNGTRQVVRYDIATGTKRIVSRRRDGQLSSFVNGGGFASPLEVNYDGSVIAFAARDAGPPDDQGNTATVSSVAVWRESTGHMETASDLNTHFPLGFAFFPSLSDNGRLLIYGNFDDELAFPPPGIERGDLDLWIHRVEGEGAAGRFVRTRVGPNAGGFSRIGHCDLRIPTLPTEVVQLLVNSSFLNCPRLSGSGNLAVFITRSNELTPGDSNMGLVSPALFDTFAGRAALDIYAVPIIDLRNQPSVAVPSLNHTSLWLLAGLTLVLSMLALRRQS
jgi:hypothetical protein